MPPLPSLPLPFILPCHGRPRGGHPVREAAPLPIGMAGTRPAMTRRCGSPPCHGRPRGGHPGSRGRSPSDRDRRHRACHDKGDEAAPAVMAALVAAIPVREAAPLPIGWPARRAQTGFGSASGAVSRGSMVMTAPSARSTLSSRWQAIKWRGASSRSGGGVHVAEALHHVGAAGLRTGTLSAGSRARGSRR